MGGGRDRPLPFRRVTIQTQHLALAYAVCKSLKITCLVAMERPNRGGNETEVVGCNKPRVGNRSDRAKNLFAVLGNLESKDPRLPADSPHPGGCQSSDSDTTVCGQHHCNLDPSAMLRAGQGRQNHSVPNRNPSLSAGWPSMHAGRFSTKVVNFSKRSLSNVLLRWSAHHRRLSCAQNHKMRQQAAGECHQENQERRDHVLQQFEARGIRKHEPVAHILGISPHPHRSKWIRICPKKIFGQPCGQIVQVRYIFPIGRNNSDHTINHPDLTLWRRQGKGNHKTVEIRQNAKQASDHVNFPARCQKHSHPQRHHARQNQQRLERNRQQVTFMIGIETYWARWRTLCDGTTISCEHLWTPQPAAPSSLLSTWRLLRGRSR